MYDGEYVSERLYRAGIQGVYFANTGALLLASNPTTEISALDSTLVLPNNVSYTAEQLWNLQIDPVKFKTNPFANQPLEVAISNTTDSLNNMKLDNAKASFDTCSFTMISQVETKELSKSQSPLRTWRAGRPLPFDSSEDSLSVGGTELDEDRLVYRMHGYIVSSGCGIVLELKNDTRSGDYDSIVTSGKLYAILAVVQVITLVYLIISHVESRSSNSAMMKTSSFGLLAQVCFDAVVSIFHLITAFTYPPISLPIYFVFFLSSAIYTMFQMKYLVEVCKFSWNYGSLTMALSRIYLVIYVYIGISLLIALLVEPYIWIPLFLTHSCWLFQIIHNARYRTRNAFDWRYIIGTTLCRAFVPAYFYAWPGQNILHIPPRPMLIFMLFLYDAFLIGMLIAQDRFGPRFFIPSWLGPATYNYRRPIPIELYMHHGAPSQTTLAPLIAAPGMQQNEVPGPTCTICMSEINPHNGEHMIAPCNHTFHEECLIRWMDQKMECPVCRGRLPVPPELDHDEMGAADVRPGDHLV